MGQSKLMIIDNELHHIGIDFNRHSILHISSSGDNTTEKSKYYQIEQNEQYIFSQSTIYLKSLQCLL